MFSFAVLMEAILLGNNSLMLFFREITVQFDDPGGEMKGFIQ